MKRTTAPEIGKYYMVMYAGKQRPAEAFDIFGDIFLRFTDGMGLHWRSFDPSEIVPIPPTIHPDQAAVNVANAVRRAMQEAMLKLPAFLHDPDDIHTGGRVLEWLMPDVVEAARAAALEVFSTQNH